MMKYNWILLLVCMTGFSAVAQKKLVPVPASGKINFVIKNFGINTNGSITGVKGTIVFDKKDLANSSFDVTADVSTVNTANSRRDNHLKAADYFNATQFPVIRITGKPYRANGDDFILKGTITMKDVTRPVEIPFKATPQQNGFLFKGAFTVNRLHFKVGGKSITLADELKVNLSVLAL